MFFKSLFNKNNWVKFFQHLIYFIKEIPDYLKFFILLFIFLYQKFSNLLLRVPVIGKFLSKIFKKSGRIVGLPIEKAVYKLNVCHPDVKTRRMFLINLAYKNLMMKKTRTFVTIFGMSVGIGVIVFLISLGYGIERLIINQVATLEETKIIDVSAGENTSVRLDQKSYRRIKKIKNVKQTIPLVSVVGKLNYKKASTDVIVYAAPRSYFDISRQKIIKGKYYSDKTNFDDNKTIGLNQQEGEVAGAYTKLKTKLKYLSAVDNSLVNFNILPQERVGIWENCDVRSRFLGYATRLEKGYQGKEYYGSSFYPFSENGLVGVDEKSGQMLGLWIKSKFPLFQNSLFEDKEILMPVFDNAGQQQWVEGCVPVYKIKIEEKINLAGDVLGESTGSASLNSASPSAGLISSQEKQSTESASFLDELTVVASSEGGIEIVSLQATQSAQTKKQIVNMRDPSGEAVVSLGLLNLLNIPQDKALKTDFELSLVVVKNLILDVEGKATTAPVKYKVIGVIDDNSSAYLYIPFSDLYKLALRNLSQLKVLLADKKDIALVRKEIETMGFKTSSVVDTIKQIESFFANIRLVLAAIGLVALVVAALGMFNTLTVSLLERTREIGGMKVMGVVSHEIEDLFLAEAMIMGLGGGFGGLILGYLTGKLASVLISIIAFASQGKFLNLTHIPLPFIIFIIGLSFFVGIGTGLYPAQRAKRISALNALRYE